MYYYFHLLFPPAHKSSKLSLAIEFKIGIIEQLDNLIYDAISTLRSNKKEPNENAMYSLISSNLNSLSKEKLEKRLNYLVNGEKFKNKPQNGKKSYYIETKRANLFSSIETPIKHGRPTTPTLIETTESPLPSDETPLRPESTTTPMFNDLQNFINQNDLLKEQIQYLAAEIKAVKMLMKGQLHLLINAQKITVMKRNT